MRDHQARVLLSVGLCILTVACSREPVAPSIGMFAITDEGAIKLKEAGDAVALTSGRAKIEVGGGTGSFRRGDSNVIEVNELREFVSNIPELPIGKVQVWFLSCESTGPPGTIQPTPDVPGGLPPCGENRQALETEITPTDQQGVYRIKILGDNKKPLTINAKTLLPEPGARYSTVGAPPPPSGQSATQTSNVETLPAGRAPVEAIAVGTAGMLPTPVWIVAIGKSTR